MHFGIGDACQSTGVSTRHVTSQHRSFKGLDESALLKDCKQFADSFQRCSVSDQQMRY